MNDKTLKNVEKWQSEIHALNDVKAGVEEFALLKDEKADKDDIAVVNDRVAALFEEHKFMKLDWKEVKKNKASRQEGIEKIEKKIADREKKLEDAGADAQDIEPADEIVIEVAEAEEARDWSEEIANCGPDSVYYHWAYGKMQVIAMEDDYIYMRMLDKKGCKYDWAAKNNAIVEIDGKEEEVKEFSVTSIGKWLYPGIEDVEILNADKAHKMFAK